MNNSRWQRVVQRLNALPASIHRKLMRKYNKSKDEQRLPSTLLKKMWKVLLRVWKKVLVTPQGRLCQQQVIKTFLNILKHFCYTRILKKSNEFVFILKIRYFCLLESWNSVWTIFMRNYNILIILWRHIKLLDVQITSFTYFGLYLSNDLRYLSWNLVRPIFMRNYKFLYILWRHTKSRELLRRTFLVWTTLS